MPEADAGKGVDKPKASAKKPKTEPPADLDAVFRSILDHPRLKMELIPRELPADAVARRKLEFWSFLVKELLPHLAAIVVIFFIAIFCFMILIDPKSSPENQQRAWTAITAILTGIVGYIFGKAVSK
jgi:hypothetical protein